MDSLGSGNFKMTLRLVLSLLAVSTVNADEFTLFKEDRECTRNHDAKFLGFKSTLSDCEQLCRDDANCAFLTYRGYNCRLSTAEECQTRRIQNGASVYQRTTGIGAANDPHMTNAKGQHFQFHKSGRFNMLAVRDSDGGPVLNIMADLASLHDVPCAATFIRRVDVTVESNASHKLSFRRAVGSFVEQASEPFDISVNDDAFQPVSSFEGMSDGILAVRRHETNECEVTTPYVTLSVVGSTSPIARRHYINLGITQMNISHLDASGLLWDDHVESAGC
jgi:hypothetical protein